MTPAKTQPWRKPLFWLPALLVGLALAALLRPAASEPATAGTAANNPAVTAPVTAPGPAESLSVQPVVFQNEQVRVLSFDDFNFEIEAGQAYDPELITPEIEALDGQLVRIRGFMLPSYKSEGIQEFVFVRDNLVCCFGPGAKICHNMQVYMVEGASASYTTRVIEVEGRFTIDTWASESGTVYSCYRIDATRVRAL